MIGWGILGAMYGGAMAHADTSGAQAAASRSELKADETNRDMKELMERFEKLILINMAMWSLIQERTGITEEELVKRIEEIDLQDGVADGKITRTLQPCPNCGRNVSPRHRRCLFCGAEVGGQTPLENV